MPAIMQKTHHTAKFQITDPPKVWVSASHVESNGMWASAILKKETFSIKFECYN